MKKLHKPIGWFMRDNRGDIISKIVGIEIIPNSKKGFFKKYYLAKGTWISHKQVRDNCYSFSMS